MKIALFGLGLLSLTTLSACQSGDAARKNQVRDQMVAECQQTVQLMAQGGMGNFPQLCTCVAAQIDNMSVEQFKQVGANPMSVMQFKQQVQTQCMQQAGALGGGMGGMGGMGSGGGMQPGVQQPGMGYGGAVEGANGATASNATK